MEKHRQMKTEYAIEIKDIFHDYHDSGFSHVQGCVRFFSECADALYRKSRLFGKKRKTGNASNRAPSRVPIFQSLSVKMEKMRLTGITGPSGCGKSTLIRLICAMEPLQKGEILIEGHPPGNGNCRQIAYLPQEDILRPSLTVLETMAHNCVIQDVENDREMIERIFDDLQLENVKSNRISQLSGGQKKRVCIGVELLKTPDLFFLDEPTSGLDPENVDRIFDILENLTRQAGVTVVVVTHQANEIARLDELIALDDKGRLVYQGAPDARNEAQNR